MTKKIDWDNVDYEQEPQVICFVVYKDCIEVTNPCAIPFGLLKKAIKSAKKLKEGEVSYVGTISIKIPYIKNSQEKANEKTRKNKNNTRYKI